MSGVHLGIEYWLTDLMSLELTVLTSDAGAAEDPVRLRLDLDLRL